MVAAHYEAYFNVKKHGGCRLPVSGTRTSGLKRIPDYMKRTLRYFFSALLILAGLVLSQRLEAQKYSNEFLSIGVGARAQAMGNAVVASVEDVTAATWNPAGLSAMDMNGGLQVGAMHAEWFAGIGKFDYLGAVIPFSNNRRRLGISLIRFGIDEIPNTLSLYESDGSINFDNVSEFSAADYAFLLSYGQALRVKKGELYVGGNIKVVHRRIGPFANSWGFGVDLAGQYRRGRWRFGAMLQDITTTFNAWSFSFTDQEKEVLDLTGNEVPINSVEITKPKLLLGVAHRFRFNKVGLLPELDFLISTDGQRNTLLSGDPFSVDLAFGLEADYNEFVYLRAGVNQFQQETDFDNRETLTMRPSLGVGFRLGSLRIDYAFTDLGDSRQTYSHVISLILGIRPKQTRAQP